MHSKFLPWDFANKFRETIDPKVKGLYAFFTDEAYVEKMLMDHLPKKELSFSIYSGVEITRDFIEEHFVNLSFFSQTDHVIVMSAETISSDSLEMLTQVDLADRYVILFFAKGGKSFNEFAKKDNVFATTIEPPRFWDGPTLWQFCLKIKEWRSDGAVSQFVLANLEHNFESFIRFIDIVSLHYPDGKVDSKRLPELVEKERWDFFELVDSFYKGPKFLFLDLAKKEKDFDWWIVFCAQMQGHLVKLLFPEEIREKSKPNKYEQSILQWSEKLDRNMLRHYLNLFSELEIMAKTKNAFLADKVRLELLSLN